jgi:small subunit ribosomal protein S17
MAKTIAGVVASKKTDKTIIVKVVTHKTHPIYKKQYSSTKRFMAHDEKNEAAEGDKVLISETRPLSARKRFTLDRITERAPVRHVEETDKVIAEVTGQKAKTDKVEKTDKEEAPAKPEEKK